VKDALAALIAAAAFEAARELEQRGELRIPGRLRCSVKLDGSAIVWAGRDVEDARLAGLRAIPAIPLLPELEPAGAGPMFAALGAIEALVGLRSTLEEPTEFRDDCSLPQGGPFREVPR